MGLKLSVLVKGAPDVISYITFQVCVIYFSTLIENVWS